MNFNVFLKWGNLVVVGVLLIGVLAVGAAQAVPARADTPQTSDVYAPFECTTDPDKDCTDVGDAQLVRDPNGVSMNLQTTELEAGAAYTVWWVVFNNPDACDNGCDLPDLFKAEVNATVLWATGHVIDSDGIGNFAAHLAEGDTSGDSFPLVLAGDDDGLVDAEAAEIHLVVRTHGQPIPDLVDKQIHTFDGGCEVNTCLDQQFAIFQP